MKRIFLLPLAVMLIVPAVAFAAFTPGFYSGKTSRATKFRPVSFAVTTSKLRYFRITVAFRCTDGDTSLASVPLSGFPQQNVVNGHYNASFKGARGGSSYVNRGSISGKIAVGTFSGFRRYDARGRINRYGTIVCRTGNVSYIARTR